MNNRQRFLATLHYQPRDRMPIADFGFWDETLVVWRDQGLPAHISNLPGERNTDGYFGMDFNLDDLGGATGVYVGLAPGFEFTVIEDRGDTEIVQQADGVRVLRHKFMSSIPTDVGHLLVDRESWRKNYLPRLDPTYPGRYPDDWDARLATWCDPQREQIVALPGGSLYGWLRDWIGMEQLSYIVYDDPAWFEEMVTTVADCILGTLSRVLATGGHFDACAMWEDMCYRGGPLLSPRHFKQYLVPHYRRIADLLHSHGVDVIWVDCDGKIDALLPLWLDAGINCMFPIEVGTWGADPLRYRQQYGRDLLMIGGVDKHILSGSQADIVQEVQRLLPLVDEGGYIALPDHRVPADVPLHNYLFYLEQVRYIWGRGIDLPSAMWGG